MPVDKFGRAKYRETSLIEDAPVSSVEGISEIFLRRDGKKHCYWDDKYGGKHTHKSQESSTEPGCGY